MLITHSKVSEAADPVDTSLVGASDWNDGHAVSGARHILSIGFTRSGGSLYVPDGVTVEQAPSPGLHDYEYKILVDELIYPVDSNCRFRALVTDIAMSYGAFAYAELVVSGEINLKTYTGNWVETYLPDNGAIWVDVFRMV